MSVYNSQKDSQNPANSPLSFAVSIINKVENELGIPIFLVGGAVRDVLLGNVPKDWDFATSKNPDEVELAIRNTKRKPYLIGKKFGTIGFKFELKTEDLEIGNHSSKIYHTNTLRPMDTSLERETLQVGTNLSISLENSQNNLPQENSQNSIEIAENQDKIQKNNQNQWIYVEITTFRAEKYQNTRKPIVEFVSGIDQDLARRDFTINAMAMGKDGKIIDNWNGQNDLQNGIIRSVENPKIRFGEDPLRMLRAIRFATQFDFEIEAQTWQKLTRMKFEIFRISKERWVLELDKILSCENVEKGLDLLMESGILGLIIPEISLQKNYNQNSNYHDFDLWTHTKKVVGNVPSEDLELRWSGLLHDIAKPFVRTENKNGKSNYIGHEILGSQMAQKICKYLNFSNSQTNQVVENIQNHLLQNSNLKIHDDNGKKEAK